MYSPLTLARVYHSFLLIIFLFAVYNYHMILLKLLYERIPVLIVEIHCAVLKYKMLTKALATQKEVYKLFYLTL